jgi:hypothetical protein
MLCWVFALFVFVLCLVYPVLPVSLDCPCLIAPMLFSNVYFILKEKYISQYSKMGRQINHTLSIVFSFLDKLY